MTRFHAPQCSWHFDQYEHECDCGVSRPATQMWAQTEVSAARLAVARANENLAITEARLREVTSQGTSGSAQDPQGLDPKDAGPVLVEDAPTPPSTVNQGEAEILREAERARIAAWFRDAADKWSAGDEHPLHELVFQKSIGLNDAADAIERGDHLTAQGVNIPSSEAEG